MTALTLEQRVVTFQPSSYTTVGPTATTLFTVRDSYFRIVSVDVRIEVAFSGGTPSIIIGVTGTTNLLVTTSDVTEGTPGVYEGSGTGLSNGGALLAPGTAVLLNYTGHASTTQGLARIAFTGYRVGV